MVAMSWREVAPGMLGQPLHHDDGGMLAVKTKRAQGIDGGKVHDYDSGRTAALAGGCRAIG